MTSSAQNTTIAALDKAKELSSSLSLTLPESLTSSDSQKIQNTVIQLTQIHVEQNIRSFSNNLENNDVKLSDRQENVLNQLYNSLKEIMKETLSLESADHAMKIGRMMAEIIKLVEKARYPNDKIPGAEKKEIAIALGKRLVSDKDVVQNETIRNGLITAYDLLGEQLLETLMDVSRNVNIAVQQAALSCCESILDYLKRR